MSASTSKIVDLHFASQNSSPKIPSNRLNNETSIDHPQYVGCSTSTIHFHHRIADVSIQGLSRPQESADIKNGSKMSKADKVDIPQTNSGYSTQAFQTHSYFDAKEMQEWVTVNRINRSRTCIASDEQHRSSNKNGHRLPSTSTSSSYDMIPQYEYASTFSETDIAHCPPAYCPVGDDPDNSWYYIRGVQQPLPARQMTSNMADWGNDLVGVGSQFEVEGDVEYRPSLDIDSEGISGTAEH